MWYHIWRNAVKQHKAPGCIRRKPLQSSLMQTFLKEVNSLPNIKSAKKRVKVIEAKTLQNKMLKSALKTSMKKYEAALASGDKAAAAETYKAAVKKIDQAVAQGLLHKNNAARKKSNYTVKLNKLGA